MKGKLDLLAILLQINEAEQEPKINVSSKLKYSGETGNLSTKNILICCSYI